MKKLFLAILLSVLFTSYLNCQYSGTIADQSYRYVSNPGFVNVTELNAAIGLGDTVETNSDYYFGISNVFGYQIDRNFFGGIGIGIYHYNEAYLLPVYLEYKYSYYLKRFTPYLYGDGGLLIHPDDFYDESKIFINPGIGVSRVISDRFEINLSAGYMIQARTTLKRVTYVNFRLGIIFRKNAFRMFRKNVN